MRTYTTEAVATWKSERDRISSVLVIHRDGEALSLAKQREIEEQLGSFIATNITPKEKELEQVRAKIDILVLPARLAQLSTTLEEQRTKVSDLVEASYAHQASLIQPIDVAISGINTKLSNLARIVDRQTSLNTFILSAQQGLRDEALELTRINLQISEIQRILIPLRTTPVYPVSVQHVHHTHGHATPVPHVVVPVKPLAGQHVHHAHGHATSVPHAVVPVKPLAGQHAHHAHGHTPITHVPQQPNAAAEFARISQISALEINIRSLVSQRDALLRSTTAARIPLYQRELSDLAVTMARTVAESGTQEVLNRLLAQKQEEKQPLTREKTRIANAMLTATSAFSETQREHEQLLARLNKAKAFIAVHPTPAELDELKASETAIRVSLDGTFQERQRLERSKGMQQTKTSELTAAIRACEARSLEMAREHFMTIAADNPIALFDRLSSKVEAALASYDVAHPFQQPMIVRQTLKALRERMEDISTAVEPQLRTLSMYGVVWDAIDKLNVQHVVELKNALYLAFGEQAFDKVQSLTAYEAIKNKLRLPVTADAIKLEESKQFQEAVATFHQALAPIIEAQPPIPADLPREKWYFYTRGQALLDSIKSEVSAAQIKGVPVDLKYYTKLLNHANLYLSVPQNANHAEAFVSIANMSTTGQSNGAKKIAGCVMMFIAAGILAATVAMMVMTAGLLSPAAAISISIGATLLAAGGALLFNAGCEKGILKRSHDFDTAAKGYSPTLWSTPAQPKGTATGIATAVPPPSAPPAAEKVRTVIADDEPSALSMA